MKINFKEHILTIIIILFLVTVISWVILSDSVRSNNDKIYSDNGMNDNVSMLFVGDIMLGRNVENNPFEFVNKLISSADVSFGNLEYSVTDSNSPTDKKYLKEKKTINLKSDCNTSKELKSVGFDVLSLANNHMMDFGEKGLKDTITCLDNLNIYYAGAGTNISNAKKLAIVKADNLKIGFLSYTSVSPKDAYAKSNRSGVLGIGDNIEDNIRGAKNQTDFLVVYVHWGNEFEMSPDNIQEEMGRKMIDAGADIVIGSHPHVIQPFEKYKDKYIFYSLGNFVFDQEHEITKSSMAIRVFLDKNAKVVKIEKINLRIKDTKPYILDKEVLQ